VLTYNPPLFVPGMHTCRCSPRSNRSPQNDISVFGMRATHIEIDCTKEGDPGAQCVSDRSMCLSPWSFIGF
jgi:hypothetical protein